MKNIKNVSKKVVEVYVVKHLALYPEYDKEDLKMIGVFSSYDEAVKGINKVKDQPGFRDNSRIIDPLKNDNISGFYINAYIVNKCYWEEGFINATDA